MSAREPRLFARLGLAIVHPRWALAVAADRRQAGRSGSDLLALIGLVLLATQLRGLVAAVWLGSAVELGLGVRAVMHVLTRALTVDLGFLVLAALVVFGLAGPRRNLGRAFDLACVAALPLLFVELAATVLVRTAELEVPSVVGIVLSAASYAWTGALVALAVRPARAASVAVPAPPLEVLSAARWTGRGLLAIALLGAAVQLAWVVRHTDAMRPMTQGEPAPAFALPEIGPKGVLGARISLADLHGKVTVLDFWATWCGPCLRAMPALDALARGHTDIAVVAVNLDDPVAARALFEERGYKLTLVEDDTAVSERYGVTTIPHTVVIDREGVVRKVHRGGGGAALEQDVLELLGAPRHP